MFFMDANREPVIFKSEVSMVCQINGTVLEEGLFMLYNK